MFFSMMTGFAASAWALPEGFIKEVVVAGGIRQGTSLAPVPDGRIFISERGGRLKVLERGEVRTLAEWEVGKGEARGDENGFLKIIAHPGFQANGKLYAFYAVPGDHHHNIDVLRVDADGSVLDRHTIAELDPTGPGYIWHNGSGMAFGKDGFLYVGRGDNLEYEKAGETDSQIGKILRFTEEGDPAPGNPYASSPSPARRSIWALGFRNPWVLAADPLSGRIFCACVGEYHEEINELTRPDGTRGYWYGWDGKMRDGMQERSDRIDPIFAYRTKSDGNAILSVVPYNPPVNNFGPEFANKLFYNDMTRTWIRYLDMDDPASGYRTFSDTALTGFRDLGMILDGHGRMWFLTYEPDGQIYVIYNGDNPATPPGSGSGTPLSLVSERAGRRGRFSEPVLEFAILGPFPSPRRARLELFDLRGKPVFRGESINLRFELDRSPAPIGPGVYAYSLRVAWPDGNRHNSTGIVRFGP